MNEKGLFRPEVLVNNRNRNYGSVSINTPLQYKTLTSFMMIVMVLIAIFIVFGEYSEKFIIKGYLESTKGIARVYPSKPGVIAKSLFQQGSLVNKGDVLFYIDTAIGGMTPKTNDAVLFQLEKKRQAIESALGNKQKYLAKLKQLLQKRYIPLALYNEKREELIELRQQKNAAELEIVKHEKSTAYAIHAPTSGRITSVSYQPGQYVNLGKSLLTILPRQTDLIAQLYVPANKSGFIHPNSRAIIRFDAYPYVRFGAYLATLHDVSQSILTDEDEEKPIRIGQPYYKATAWLDKQIVTVNGRVKELRQGMTISAVIVGNKRKIWQWIFDPIYNFYGNLFI